MRNSHGIDIRPCCASCGHRKIAKDKRSCKLDGTTVESSHLCDSWVMSEGMMNAGRSGGTVRDIVTKEVILR